MFAQLAPFCSNEILYEILALSKPARLGLNPFTLGVRRWRKNIHYQKTFYKPIYVWFSTVISLEIRQTIPAWSDPHRDLGN